MKRERIGSALAFVDVWMKTGRTGMLFALMLSDNARACLIPEPCIPCVLYHLQYKQVRN